MNALEGTTVFVHECLVTSPVLITPEIPFREVTFDLAQKQPCNAVGIVGRHIQDDIYAVAFADPDARPVRTAILFAHADDFEPTVADYNWPETPHLREVRS